MAFNLLDGLDYVQQQGEAGRNRYADKLLGQAYAAPQEQRQSALAKLAGTDGRLAMAAENQLAQRDDDRQKRQADILVRRAKVAASMPPEALPQLWPSLRASIAQEDPELGAQLPEAWDESFRDMIQQFAGVGGGAKIHSQRVLADGRILNTYADGRTEVTDHVADRQSWFANNEGVDPYIAREDGTYTKVGPGGAQPQPTQAPQPQLANGDPKADALMQAMNAMIKAGVPPEQVEAFFQQAASAAGLNPQAAPADAGAMLPTSGGGGGPAASGAPVAPPAPAQGDISRVPINDLGGGAINPLRRPVKPQTEAEESFGQPQAVTDPATGKVIMVQFGNRGGRRVVGDYAPAPTDRDAKPPTEGERAASGYLNRMNQAEMEMEATLAAGHDPGNMRDYVAAGQGPWLNWAASDEGQKYRQAQEDWVRSKLRKESGAVIGDDEMAREIKVYFPQPGDSQTVIEQKKRSRTTAIEQMRRMAGRAEAAGAAPRPAAPAPASTGGGGQTVRLRFNPATGDFE